MGNTLSKIPLLCRRLFRRNTLPGERRTLPGWPSPDFPSPQPRWPPCPEPPCGSSACPPPWSQPPGSCVLTSQLAHPEAEGVPFTAGQICPCGEPAAVGELEGPSKEDCPVAFQSARTLGNHENPSSSAKFYSPAFPTRADSSLVPGPSSSTRKSGSQKMKVKVQGKPQNGMAEREEHHVETNGQGDKTTNASANLTGQPTVNAADVTDKDTTPPSDVFVFTAPPCRFQRSRRRPRATSPPCCLKRSHRHPRAYCWVANPPNSVDSSTGPPASKYLWLAPCYGGGPQSTPQPTSGTCGGWKRKTSVVSAEGRTKQPLVNSAATHAPANSAAANPVDDSEPMDTTSAAANPVDDSEPMDTTPPP